MMMNYRKLIMAIAMLLPLAAGAQVFTRFNVPTHLCAGTRDTLTFGFRQQNDVVIDVPIATLSHPGMAFLPDGEECGDYGCSYRSNVTFTDFPANARISSAQDIQYVRLNIEHSYIGDIYINITCPNNQKATLMRFGGSSTSNCQGTIPGEQRGWLSGSNASTGTFFGMAYDNENWSQKCNPNASGNEPGVGWNYCWSNNTGIGIQYAAGDGIIYRSSHAHNGRIDSSNVAQRRNFYHPDQNFSALAGCPLNGTWYIEVVDGYSVDNGYIFDWELALNPNLLPNACGLQSRTVIGSWITRLNDSTYILDPPNTLASDTTIAVTFRMINTCNDTVDSVAHIQIHPRYNTRPDTTACDSIHVNGATYLSSTYVRTYHTTAHGCDSIEYLHLTIKHSSSLQADTCVVQNDLPYSIGGIDFAHPVADTLITGLTNAAGCDSTIRFSLCVWMNKDTVADTSLCQHLLPLAWNTHTIDAPGSYVAQLATSHGADSVVTLNVEVRPDSHNDISDTLVENQLPSQWVAGHQFYRDTDTTMVIDNHAQCDSIIHYSLKVWWNEEQRYDTVVCQQEEPILWHGITFTGDADTTLFFHTTHGADSIVSLTFHNAPTYDTLINASICNGKNYLFGSAPITQGGTYHLPLQSLFGCDSTVHLDLTVYPTYSDTISDTVCAKDGYLFEGINYSTSGLYTHRYTTIHGCDSLKNLNLHIKGENLLAIAHASRTIVTLEKPQIEFNDNSRAALDREWTIGDYVTNQKYFVFTYPEEYDTLIATLVAISDEGCTDTASILLQIDRSFLSTPNAFTPNLESNNTWSPGVVDIVELEVWIYNRQGNLVHHYTGIDGSWDGRDLNGTPCPQGSYIYKAQYRTRVHAERLIVAAGTILLIR